MRGPPSSFWGKLSRDDDGNVAAWHPLVDHCADVAACCEALLERTLLRRRLARLARLDDLDEVQRARLCFLAALHDAGKFNLGFQRKAGRESRDIAGHVREAFALLGAQHTHECELFLAAVTADEIVSWNADRLLYAHHGAPVQVDAAPPLRRDLWRRAGGLDPFAGLADLSRSARAWFPACRREGTPFPDEAAFAHAFSGLITLADWVGSDERLFPYAEEGAGDRVEFARARARGVLSDLWLDGDGVRGSLGTTRFEDLFRGRTPRPAQRAVIDLPIPKSASLDILEAETGSGKTEAAICRFVALLSAGAVDGMYFALPTRTAATRMHGRVVQAVRAAFPDVERRPPVVLAVPGYLRVDDVDGTREAPRLARFGVLWTDDCRRRPASVEI